MTNPITHPFGHLANLIEEGLPPARPWPATVRSLRKIAEVIECGASFTTVQVGFAYLHKVYSNGGVRWGLERSRADTVAAISHLICHPTYGRVEVRRAADLWNLIVSNEAFNEFAWFDKLIWKREAEMLAEWNRWNNADTVHWARR